MSAGIYNIEIDQGSDFEINLTIAGQNLDGYSVRGQIRPTKTSDVLLASFTTEVSGGSSTGGDVKVTLPNYESAAIPGGVYVYDLEAFNDTTRAAVRILQGTVTVLDGVTR